MWLGTLPLLLAKKTDRERDLVTVIDGHVPISQFPGG